MKRVCKQCGKEFEITESEAQFFKSKGLQLPKRCKECRAKNKDKAAPVKQNSAPVPVAGKPAIGGSVFKPIVLIAFLAAFIIAAFFLGKSGLFRSESTVPPDLLTTTVTTSSATQTTEAAAQTESETESTAEQLSTELKYHFRSAEKLNDHFDKHGAETGCSTKQEYLEKANAVIENPNALHKYEAEDGDDVYFISSTGEICFVSRDGYIRTYFISDYDYYSRQ